MGKSQHIKAIIWDMGGVILRTANYRPRRRWEERCGLQTGDLERLVFSGEVGLKAYIGKASIEEVWASVCRSLAIPLEECSALERDFWRGDELDLKLIAYVRSLRTNYKIGLLSNAWSDLRHFMTEVWQIADAFDDIVISSEVGILKPDPHIYRLALGRLGFDPEQAVFVDDFEENVLGARGVGMTAIHFQTADDTIVALNRLLNID